MDINLVHKYGDMINKLNNFINFEKTPTAMTPNGLGTVRMTELLNRLGNPETSQPAIHIAGTKGKGSTANLLTAILRMSGMRVGIYTSPHILDIRERITVANNMLSKEAFVRAASVVFKVTDEMEEEGNKPSYFEVLTAIAFVAFKDAKVDVAVVEVGLGGRLDATNVPTLPVVVSGITTISYDHQEILGYDLVSIAKEKAAIIRDKTPVVSARQAEVVDEVLTNVAEEKKSPLFRINTDFNALTSVSSDKLELLPGDLQRLDLESWLGQHDNVPLALLGRHQIENAALAFALAEIFLERMGKQRVDTLTLRRAWRNIKIPGRLEVFSREPWVVLDSAHNPASFWVAAETIQERFDLVTDRTLVFAASKDKDIDMMLKILAPVMSRVILTTFNYERCYDPEIAKKYLEKNFPDIEVHLEINQEKALDLAFSSTSESGLIFITGSFYLLGEVKEKLEHKKLALA